MVNRVCWKCGIATHMSLPKSEVTVPGIYRSYPLSAMEYIFPRDSNGEPQGKYVYAILVCDECGYPNIAKYAVRQNDSGEFEYSAVPVEWIPSRAEDHSFADVPKRVASAANEAFRCFSIQAYRSSVIMARSVLEGIANEKIRHRSKTTSKGKEFDKGLTEKIKDMEDEEVISKKLGDKASAIKDIGNNSTHSIFQEISKEEASIVLDFLDLVIQEVYTQEAQLKKLEKTSDKIERKKEKSQKK